MSARADVDVSALETELRNNLRGEVRFSDGDRALYSTDSSNYRQIPIGVVVPHDRSDVITTVAICRKFGAPITCRGGGTSLAGQCCNVAVIIDFTKYINRIIEIDAEKKLARVEPGLVLDELQGAAHRFDADLDEDARRLLDVVARGLDEARGLPQLGQHAAGTLGPSCSSRIAPGRSRREIGSTISSCARLWQSPLRTLQPGPGETGRRHGPRGLSRLARHAG